MRLRLCFSILGFEYWLGFGLIVGTNALHFNLSQIIPILIAIISFLAYRIYQPPNFSVISKTSLFGPLFDFFFVPIVRVAAGDRGLRKSIYLADYDFLIEAHLKAIRLFRTWFLFWIKEKIE